MAKSAKMFQDKSQSQNQSLIVFIPTVIPLRHPAKRQNSRQNQIQPALSVYLNSKNAQVRQIYTVSHDIHIKNKIKMPSNA